MEIRWLSHFKIVFVSGKHCPCLRKSLSLSLGNVLFHWKRRKTDFTKRQRQQPEDTSQSQQPIRSQHPSITQQPIRSQQPNRGQEPIQRGGIWQPRHSWWQRWNRNKDRKRNTWTWWEKIPTETSSALTTLIAIMLSGTPKGSALPMFTKAKLTPEKQKKNTPLGAKKETALGQLPNGGNGH